MSMATGDVWNELRECQLKLERMGREAQEYCADAAHFEAKAKRLEDALRGMLELDGYRPRDGSVNEDWETLILNGARGALYRADRAEEDAG